MEYSSTRILRVPESNVHLASRVNTKTVNRRLYLMNYYPHHIGDFNNSTRHLTRIERSIYRDLIELYYDSEEPLAGDLKTLCRKIIAITEEEVAAVEQVLEEYFNSVENVYIHARCANEIEKYKNNKGNKSKAGKASAKSRAKAKVLKGKEKVTHKVNPTPVQQKADTKLTPVANHNQEPEPEPIIKDKGKRFAPPTLDEVREHFFEKQSNDKEAERFYLFYDSKNWMVGKNKMKKWKSSASLWISKNNSQTNQHHGEIEQKGSWLDKHRTDWGRDLIN